MAIMTPVSVTPTLRWLDTITITVILYEIKIVIIVIIVHRSCLHPTGSCKKRKNDPKSVTEDHRYPNRTWSANSDHQ